MGTPAGTKNEQIYSVVGSAAADYSSVDAVPGNATGVARGLYLEVAGTVKVTYQDGSVDTLANLAAGIWHPMQVAKVWHTGTTASLGIHFGF